MTTRGLRAIAAAFALVTLAACGPKRAPSVAGAPAFPAYPVPDVPAALAASPRESVAQTAAWQLLQAGDVRSATKAFAAILKQSPSFYPAETGLGFSALADRQFKSASDRFKAALARDDRYVPAWIGDSEAELGLGNEAEATAAMERVLVLDPGRAEIAARLDIVRAREIQALLETGRRARLAGRLDEARTALERVGSLAPASGIVFLERARVDLAGGDLDRAEADARQAVALEPANAEALEMVAEVQEARGQFADAAGTLESAIALDPRAEWKARAAALGDRAALSVIPAEFRDVEKAAIVTRAQVAAFVTIKLDTVLARAPQAVPPIATDVRAHWAAPFILRVTQAGVMDLQPNHTFQPEGTLRRADLAQVASALLNLVGTAHATDVARWTASRPTFSDLPVGNLFYRAAALAVAAGTMTTAVGDRFDPMRSASGAEVAAVVARIGQLAQ